MEAYAHVEDPSFAASDEQFTQIKERLVGSEAIAMSNGALEKLILAEGTELMRRLFQDHLRLRTTLEREHGMRRAVRGSDGEVRTHRRDTARGLETLFGGVEVERVGYGSRTAPSLHPADAALNLPEDRYSHGVRRRIAELSACGSFDQSIEELAKSSGATLGKRQAEELAVRAASDFDAFYESREQASRLEAAQTGDILVLSVDGKGIVMRPEDLRPATRKAASKRRPKLSKRRSKGEKAGTKRMATVAAVYTAAPHVRTADDVVHDLRRSTDAPAPTRRPQPENKRVWASVTKPPATVIEEVFAEAQRRDPSRAKRWTALVDGQESQLSLLEAAASRHGVELTIILDVIHVIEYLWKAAWAFHAEGDPLAQDWVGVRLRRILEGEAIHVAAGIRRSATLRGLTGAGRTNVDKACDYLLKNAPYLRYHEYLADGRPIATGVIEGACRHLVKDRMDLTGARWRLAGAEAVLRLRALRVSHDLDAYWSFHEQREYERNHQRHYAGTVPCVIGTRSLRERRAHLRLVK